MSEPTALYRYHARDDGRLIYVGTTRNPEGRDDGHENESPWWSFCAPPELEWYPSKEDALSAERAVIKAESPLFNGKGRSVGAALIKDRNRWLSYRIRHALGTLS